MLGFYPIGTAPICSLNILVRSLSETLTVGESVSRYKIVSPSISDTVSLSESHTKYKIAPRSVSDTISVTEQLRQSPIPGAGSDTITVSESATLIKLKNVSVFDTISLGESIETHGIVSRDVSDTINILEYVGRSFTLSVSDTVSITESRSYATGGLTQRVNDTVVLAESVSVSKIITKSLSDTITVSESGLRVIPIALQETVNVIESIGYKYIFNLAVADAVSIYENPVTFQNVKKVRDSISVIEVLTYRLVPKLNVSDTITLGESVSPHLVPLTNLAETITLTEDVELRHIPQQNVVDDINIYEHYNLDTVLHYSFCDCIIISEQARRVKELSVSDSITLVENANNNPLFDTIYITESVVTNIIPRCCSDIGYLPDHGLNDSVLITETVGLKKVLNISIVESIAVNDTVVYLP